MRDEEPCDTCGAASHNLRANKAEGRADAAEALLRDLVEGCPDCDGKGNTYTLGDAMEFGVSPGRDRIDCPRCTDARAFLAETAPKPVRLGDEEE